MATAVLQATINPAGNASAVTAADKAGIAYAIGADDPINDTYGAVNVAIATLVADGASPTEAHVTALDGAWDDFTTEFVALGAALAQLSTFAGVSMTVDLTTIDTITKLRKAMNALIEGAKSSGNFGA